MKLNPKKITILCFFFSLFLWGIEVLASGSCKKVLSVKTNGASKRAKVSFVANTEMGAMDPYRGIEVNGKKIWLVTHIVQILESNEELGLVGSERIVVYFPNKEKGAQYHFHVMGTNETLTYKGVTLQEMPEATHLGSMKRKLRVFKLIGKLPETEEYKTLQQKNIRTQYDLAQVQTREDFDKLGDNQKESIIGIPASMNKHVQTKEDVTFSALKTKAEKDFATKMRDWLEVNVIFENHQSGVVPIVPAQYFFTITKDIKGQILGGKVVARIDGVSYEGDRSSFYSLKEALEAGAEKGDISWQASQYFQYDLSPLGDDSYWDWTGY